MIKSITRPSQCRFLRAVLLAIIVALVVANVFTSQSANALAVVPPNVTNSYPGMDARLIGAPMKKTDTSAALVAYSEAVARVDQLKLERENLNTKIEMLKPELERATVEVSRRKQEYNNVRTALAQLVIVQYQDLSADRNRGTSLDDTSALRLSNQSVHVSESLRKWKVKAEAKKNFAEKYLEKVKNQMADSEIRIQAIDGELPAATEAAQERKDVVRSGIPLAVIDGLDIPILMMDAYLRAETTLAVSQPGCAMKWWVMAGIGRAESNHSRFGGAILDNTGTVSPKIIGVALNGNGFAAIGDSDKGLYDGDTEWDRAVGVMQFIPGTWNRWGSDGNDDGVADPQNVYDAALSAGRYLCAGNRNMDIDSQRYAAFLSYNRSRAYADFVFKKGLEYAVLGAGRFNLEPIISEPPQ